MNESPETHELPQPQSAEKHAPASGSTHEAQAPGIEQQLSQPEQTPMASAGSLPGTSQQATIPAQGATNSSPAVNIPLPAIADDGDIIEKEWVEKAKAIVAMTKADPRQENKEINKFKADYIKKRYNKTIKVNDD